MTTVKNVTTNRRRGRKRSTKYKTSDALALHYAGMVKESEDIPVQSAILSIGEKGSGKSGALAIVSGIHIDLDDPPNPDQYFKIVGNISDSSNSSGGYMPYPSTHPVLTHPPQKEPKYTTDEMKCRFIAYATIHMGGVEHTGILSVRKCGAWKLVGCSTLCRIAGDSAGAVLPDHKIHYYIYRDAPGEPVRKPTATETKQKQKPGRFDDLEVI
jgi:hypothetical protein